MVKQHLFLPVAAPRYIYQHYIKSVDVDGFKPDHQLLQDTCLSVKLVKYVHCCVINVKGKTDCGKELTYSWVFGLKLNQVVS